MVWKDPEQSSVMLVPDYGIVGVYFSLFIVIRK